VKKHSVLLALALLLAVQHPLHARRARERAARRGPAPGAEALNEGRLADALLAYKRQLGKSDSAALRCEYAFTLAKLGLGDAALAELDLASTQKGFPGEGQWFRSKILRAAGAGEAADELGGEAPDWLKNKSLADFPGRGSGNALNARFLNANTLAAQGRLHAAAGEFAGALGERPRDFLGWIGYSVVLEKLGAPASAAKALEKAAPLAAGSAGLKELLQGRREQLAELGALKPARREAARKKQLESAKTRQARTLLFGGGSFGGGSTALAGRFGYFMTPVLDASVDLSLGGLGQPAGSSTGSQLGGGVSSRYYWPMGAEKGGAMALGARLGYFAGQTTVTISPGYTSPFGDLFLDLTLNSTGFTIGVTVGATSYFGGGQ
jgi:hypothetical protein